MRVLVVDDARTMRSVIADVVRAAGHQVAGEAGDGEEAVRQNRALRPDLITLDIEMPGIGGLDVLRTVMAERPTRVVLVSSHTTQGADVTLEGLALGAVDFVPKPSILTGREVFAAALADALRGAAAADPCAAPRTVSTASAPHVRAPLRRPRLVVVAASTGGPEALHRFFSSFRTAPAQPVLVIQHMPAQFTGRLAARLDRSLSFPVSEASDDQPLRPGSVLVAAGDRHLGYRAGRVFLRDTPPIGRLRPAADVTLAEIARDPIAGRTLVVVLSGMGRDGLAGARLVVQAGGQVVAQDAGSSTVDGMPRAIREHGLAAAVADPARLASIIEASTVRGAA